MNRRIVLCVLLAVSIGCGPHQKKTAASKTSDQRINLLQAPFSLAIVPTESYDGVGTIQMAEDGQHDFYVVFTNVSKEPQAVFEDWNSWGYFAISFEFTTEDGRKSIVSRKRTVGFTKNAPSTFVIVPGEHQVFPVHLDKWWESRPLLRKTEEMRVKVKAVYELSPTPESVRQKVWTGRIESRTYDFTLMQWWPHMSDCGSE